MALDITTILLSLGTSVITAGITSYINSGKTKVEIAKIKAETDKIITETKNLSIQVSSSTAASEFDMVYYDSSKISQFDFDFECTKEYNDITKNEFGEKGKGTFSVKDGMINIDRKNTAGRLAIVLKAYKIEDADFEYIKSNPAITNFRKIHVSCEVKSLSNVKHGVFFALREIDNFNWLANEQINVIENKWSTFNAYLRVSPDKNFRLKIYDRFVESPSSIQIRNLKIVEKL